MFHVSTMNQTFTFLEHMFEEFILKYLGQYKKAHISSLLLS